MQYLICNIKCNIKYKNAYLQHAIFNIINIQRQCQETLMPLSYRNSIDKQITRLVRCMRLSN